MKKIDLEGMSRDELDTLKKDVEKAIETVEQRQREEALAAARKAAKEYGFSLDELTGAPKRAKAKAKSPPKYRHPKNPDLTWGGRGRRPAWLEEELAKGKKIGDFAVD